MVGTVDGAQGAESDLVILSFVRANRNVCTGPSNPGGRSAPARTLVASLLQPVSTFRSLPRPSARLSRPSLLCAVGRRPSASSRTGGVSMSPSRAPSTPSSWSAAHAPSGRARRARRRATLCVPPPPPPHSGGTPGSAARGEAARGEAARGEAARGEAARRPWWRRPWWRRPWWRRRRSCARTCSRRRGDTGEIRGTCSRRRSGGEPRQRVRRRGARRSTWVAGAS